MNLPYKIYVGGERIRIERVITALFERGYVFDRLSRLRNFDDVTHRWPVTMSNWNYIVIGNDSDCKAVLSAFHSDNGECFRPITIEDFLKLTTK